MYSTSLSRHCTTALQIPSSLATRLYSFTPGRPKTAPGRLKIDRAGVFAGLEIPALPNLTVVDNNASEKGHTRRFNKNKAKESHSNRTRTFQPGLSWLGDDEFESTGLALKLARHHRQRVADSKSTGSSDLNSKTNGKMNTGSGPRRNDGKTRTQVRTSDTNMSTSRHKRNPSLPPRPKEADPPRTRPPTQGNLEVRPKTDASRRTLKPSPIPQTPIHLDFGSTDFTSLFGVHSPLSTAPSTTGTKTIATDAVSRRVQLALEHHGGDYSRLVPNSLATSQGDPLVYAASTVARRRDLGPNGRNNALEIVRGMVGKSLVSQSTT